MQNFQITQGPLHSMGIKTVIYGVEGVGKTTLASQFPDPLFIDVEGSTYRYNVKRLPTPSSWEMLLQEIDYVKNAMPCKTLVIDTGDAAEIMCTDYVCERGQKKSITAFGYGDGLIQQKEEFGKMLNRLSDLIQIGINVTLVCHSQIIKFESPEESGSYDRYELKLGDKTKAKTSPLVKEWADMVLFLNFKTLVYDADSKGRKKKAQGGDERVMYTTHNACWDAKNRFGLPPICDVTYEVLRPVLEGDQPVIQQPDPVMEQPSFQIQQDPYMPAPEQEYDLSGQLDPAIPQALRDLMVANAVTEDEICQVVTQKGYFPAGMKIRDYDPDFVQGVLVGAWPQVLAMINENKLEF